MRRFEGVKSICEPSRGVLPSGVGVVIAVLEASFSSPPSPLPWRLDEMEYEAFVFAP